MKILKLLGFILAFVMLPTIALAYTVGWTYNPTLNNITTYPNNTTTVLITSSSTISTGTQAGGLTVDGGATTTLNAYFASLVGVGTTTPIAKLSVQANTGDTNPFIFMVSSSTGAIPNLPVFSVDSNKMVQVNTNATPFTINGSIPALLGRFYEKGIDGIGNVIGMDSFGNQNNIIMRRADNTAASTTNVKSAETLGQIGFRGYAASAYTTANRAGIIGAAGGDWTDISNPTYISFSTTPVNGVAQVERMRIDTTGYLGLGTTAPLSALSINIPAAATTVLAGQQVAGRSNAVDNFSIGIQASDDGASNSRSNINFGTTVGSGGADSFIGFLTNYYGVAYSEKMRIDRNGYVGIGISNPATLQANYVASGFNGLTVISGSGSFMGMSANSVSQSTIGYDNAHPLTFGTINSTAWGGYSEKARLDVNGNLGLGVTPASKLDVGGGVGIGSYAGVNTAPTNGLIVSGNTGIGTSTPSAKLAVHANNGETNTVVFAVASSTVAATTTLFSIGNQGQIRTGGGTPAVSTCGTSPTITGNDTTGTVTVGAGVITACTVTFSTPKVGTVAPMIQVEGVTALATSISAKSTTAFTVTFAASLGSGVFDYFIPTY